MAIQRAGVWDWGWEDRGVSSTSSRSSLDREKALVSRSPSGSDQSGADITISLCDVSHIGEARRVVTALARRLGFNEMECGKAALVVSEAAGNVVKHAGEGELLVRVVANDDTVGLELLLLDKGPGMIDASRCLRDGFSTAGTPGTGLGAIVRMSGFFDLHSLPAVGTAVLIRVWAKPEIVNDHGRSSDAKTTGSLEV